MEVRWELSAGAGGYHFEDRRTLVSRNMLCIPRERSGFQLFSQELASEQYPEYCLHSQVDRTGPRTKEVR